MLNPWYLFNVQQIQNPLYISTLFSEHSTAMKLNNSFYKNPTQNWVYPKTNVGTLPQTVITGCPVTRVQYSGNRLGHQN